MKNKKCIRVKRKVIGKQVPSKNSIIGGTDNPAAVKCSFYVLEGSELGGEFTAQSCHEGHVGMMHGGFIESVLDEYMGRSVMCMEQYSDGNCSFVTGEMTVRFIRPICVGRKMRVFARVDEIEGRKHFASSEIVDEDDYIMATATGIFVKVDRLVESLETTDENGCVSWNALKLQENDLKEL